MRRKMRRPGFQSSEICDGCESYLYGGPACSLVAKGFLLMEKTADIAIQNGGGCRTDLRKGDFSIGDAYSMLPFSNTMLTMKMTGAEVRPPSNMPLKCRTSAGAWVPTCMPLASASTSMHPRPKAAGSLICRSTSGKRARTSNAALSFYV